MDGNMFWFKKNKDIKTAYQIAKETFKADKEVLLQYIQNPSDDDIDKVIALIYKLCPDWHSDSYCKYLQFEIERTPLLLQVCKCDFIEKAPNLAIAILKKILSYRFREYCPTTKVRHQLDHIDEENNQGETALYTICKTMFLLRNGTTQLALPESTCIKMACMLLKRGVDIYIPDDRGNFPIDLAEGDKSLTKLLMNFDKLQKNIYS